MIFLKKLFLGVLFILFSTTLMAQEDCVLGVGFTDDAILIDVFQMSEMQQKQLADFKGELKHRNELLNAQLEDIATRHPQSTVEELTELAGKYNGIMDSMRLVQATIDKRVLATFNQKQYDRYLSLCKEANRTPYVVEPKVYGDSIIKKQ
ncbi:hypothetical protein J8L85_08030 [Maribacter sp. MMG018]|uniref:hypothetical protein n=1 Tax=Maribacter sp. MMG018 TaxID=2822688 RepID=UPI001B38935F|nr:hypothetical protein [Maribacter sp. MMG018]MBQ4914379.1 hypothetical protein [Maribacter sp. MMG018]